MMAFVLVSPCETDSLFPAKGPLLFPKVLCNNMRYARSDSFLSDNIQALQKPDVALLGRVLRSKLL